MNDEIYVCLPIAYSPLSGHARPTRVERGRVLPALTTAGRSGQSLRLVPWLIRIGSVTDLNLNASSSGKLVISGGLRCHDAILKEGFIRHS